jgi:hypothetical protein
VEETAGPANTLLSQLGDQGGVTGKAVRRATRGRSVGNEVHLEAGPASTEGPPPPSPTTAPDAGDVVVIASGNLAMVWFTRFPGRMTHEEIDAAYPGLVSSLVTHPGVGYVVVRSRDRGNVVLGRDGVRYLDDNRVEGGDPLAVFGERAAAEVRRHAELAHVGDLIINSPLYPGTDEVAAYEELVGNHGGLGGWQTQAVLVHPSAWTADEDTPLDGADAVHHQLVHWLCDLGHRSGIPTGSTVRTGD